MQKADHSGHRARMKKKLLENGMDVFEPHEVLEILLYYAIPQRNTNDIAKNLIKYFGSLYAVFDASVDSLMNAGLTEHQAILLHMIPDITRLYISEKRYHPKATFDYRRIEEYILDKFIGYGAVEHVFLLLMNKQGREVYSGMVSEGGFDSTEFPLREIVALAISHGATSAVLAHNHPSGRTRPSREDIVLTHKAEEALRLVRVSLLDHFVVADDHCESMYAGGYMGD